MVYFRVTCEKADTRVSVTQQMLTNGVSIQDRADNILLEKLPVSATDEVWRNEFLTAVAVV